LETEAAQESTGHPSGQSIRSVARYLPHARSPRV